MQKFKEENMTFKQFGIDISKYQGEINLTALKSQIDFAIIRGGYTGYGAGTPTVDEQFERNYKLCEVLSIPKGYYYLSIASNDAMVEAEYQFILKQLEGKTFDYPIIIDIENCANAPYKHAQAWLSLSKAERTRLMDILMTKLEAQGLYVMFYCNYEYATQKLDFDTLKKHDFWYARYVDVQPTVPKTPNLWQYKSNGRLTGYNSNLDFNYAFVDYPTLIKKLGFNGYGVEEEEVDYKALYQEALKENELLEKTTKYQQEKLAKIAEEIKDLANIMESDNK